MGEASFEACGQSECLTERENRFHGGDAGLHGPRSCLSIAQSRGCVKRENAGAHSTNAAGDGGHLRPVTPDRESPLRQCPVADRQGLGNTRGAIKGKLPVEELTFLGRLQRWMSESANLFTRCESA